MKKFCATGNGSYASIREVDAIRETAESVWINFGGDVRRCAKKSDYASYHDTWEQAKERHVAKASSALQIARIRAESAEKELAAVKAMTEAPANPTKDI